jgi:hypothetical protein
MASETTEMGTHSPKHDLVVSSRSQPGAHPCTG